MIVKTNNVPRDILEGWETTPEEREELDYIDWPAVERGEASVSLFRFKDQVYDLGEFDTTSRLPEFNPLRRWDGYSSDSFFSGVVVRYTEDHERIVVGTFYA